MSSNIILIGMPGSGKSTLSKVLSSNFSCESLDLDHLIEKKAGKSIPQLFSEKGEAHFRELEQLELQKLSTYTSNYILATGGGTPCFYNNMELLNKLGITVYLKWATEDLLKNLKNTDLNKRPLFAGLSQSELIDKLSLQLNDRAHFYNQSNITVELDNKSNQQQVLDEIELKILRWMSSFPK